MANLGNQLGKLANFALKPFGLAITPSIQYLDKVPDLSPSEKQMVQECSVFSMTSQERLVSMFLACKYVAENDIPGDIVECGVWRGGNAFLAKKAFEHFGSPRTVWLFDTFSGMTEPTASDRVSLSKEPASKTYLANVKGDYVDWCYASLEDVKSNAIHLFGNLEGLRFVAGDVLETLKNKENLPESISLLRLDTDWYESTKTELEVLYPKLSSRGVLVIDDYGHWDGAKLAVDEYFAGKSFRPLLTPVDDTGRVAIKTELPSHH